MPQIRTARCYSCKRARRLSAFKPYNLNKSRTGGECIDCKRARDRARPDNIARLRAWDAAHPGKSAARLAQWRKDHPMEQAALQKRRAKLIKQNGGTHTAEEWWALVARFGGFCLACHSSGFPLTKDHVIPICKGGRDDIANLQPLCEACNRAKGTQSTDYRIDWEGTP